MNVLVLALLFLTASGVAFAFDDLDKGIDLAPKFGAEWRAIARDKSTVTSDCIGSNESPGCLIDTALACAVWSYYDTTLEGGTYVEDPICRYPISVYNMSPSVSSHAQSPESNLYYFYDFWLVDAESAASFNRLSMFRKIQEGDKAIDVRFKLCRPEPSCILETNSHSLRPVPSSRCPRTECLYINYPDYTKPSATFVLRPTSKGIWTYVGKYYPGYFGMGGESREWNPAHWKEK